MSVRDTATYMGVSSQHVYRLASQGRLGRTAAPFRKKDVDAYLADRWEQQKKPRTSPPPAGPSSVTASCAVCRNSFDLSRLYLAFNDQAAGLLCPTCVLALFEAARHSA
jgi:predicted DNA-binding transcriptional regulator AlpA